MTQPLVPALVPQGAPLVPWAAPQPAPQQGAGAGPSFDEEIAAMQAEAASIASKRDSIEGEHGALETAGTQFTRGVLDFVMAPAALAGAALEGGGAVSGWEGLEDFGRDFGKSAQAKELMAVFGEPTAEALKSLSGSSDGEGALSAFERTQRTLAEQEKAWPMLSATSHLAGSVAAGLGVGGLAAGHAALGTQVGAAAYEGAAYGAQKAYSKDAPLREVFSSALVGAALGGGLTYGVHRVGHALQHRAAHKASEAEKLAVFGLSDDAVQAGITVERAGGRDAQRAYAAFDKELKLVREAGEGLSQNAARQAKAQAADEAVARLTQKAGPLEPGKAPNFLQKIVYRREILNQSADEVVAAAANAAKLRPSLATVELAPNRLVKLLKDADAPAAIGALQSRVGKLMGELPKTAQGDLLRLTLRDASNRLAKVGLPEAMADSHKLVKLLADTAQGAADPITQRFAARASAELADDLGGAAFGKAGALYRDLSAAPSAGFAALGNRELVREALRTADVRGRLPVLMRDHAAQVELAEQAAAKLTGTAAPKGTLRQLAEAQSVLAKAEEAVTLDGGSVGRVLNFFKDKAEDKVVNAVATSIGGAIGGFPGAAVGSIVSSFVRPRLGAVVQVAKGLRPKHLHVPHLAKHAVEHTGIHAAQGSAIGAVMSGEKKAAAKAMTMAARQEQFKERSEMLASLVRSPDHDGVAAGVKAISQIAPGIESAAAADLHEKLANLARDMPRPTPNVRGKAFEVMSSEDLRIANAMWLATTEPMGLFDDFAAGSLDYDRVNYTWKQYPGLKLASQMGLIDIMNEHLSDDEKAGIPDHVLSQLDSLFQMEGTLQGTLDRGFSQRITMAAQAQAQQQKPPPRGQVNTPMSKPTFAGRLAQRT
jgi:hypothetical protein